MADDMKTIQKLTRQCGMILHGKDPNIQGAVLCDLLAMFIAGHHPDLRKTILDLHLEHLHPLIAANDRWPRPQQDPG